MKRLPATAWATIYAALIMDAAWLIGTAQGMSNPFLDAEKLLIEDVPYEVVAEQCKLSMVIVEAIAREVELMQEQQFDELDEVRSTTYTRCPECGGRVYMPCRACGLRKLLRKEAA